MYDIMLFNFENEDNMRDLREESMFFDEEIDEVFGALEESHEEEYDNFDEIFGEDFNDNYEEFETYDESFEELDDLFEAMLESEYYDDEEDYVLNEAGKVSIVKFDMKTIKKRLMRRAQLICAKEANDPLYQKYVAFSKKRKEIRAHIASKYEAKAKAKLKKFLMFKKNKNANKK